MLVIVALVLIICGVLFRLDYSNFVKERGLVRETFKSMQTSYGQVLYLDIGPKDAPAILFSTGGGAGLDAVLTFDWLIQAGYRIIAVNRPGYYHMPLDSASSIREHATIYHQVVEGLGIHEISVFGVSMGGLSALYYAQTYKTKSLVLWSAVTKAYTPNQEAMNSPLGKLVMTDKGKSLISWMMVKSVQLFPKSTIESFLKTEAYLEAKERKELAKVIASDKKDRTDLLNFVYAMTPMDQLYEGMMDEVEKASKEQEIEWTNLTMPVLAIHSSIDKDVSIEHFEHIRNKLNHLSHMTVRAAGHFIWWGPEGKDVCKRTLEFLEDIYPN